MHSFDIEIATQYGVDCAIMLNNFKFWWQHNIANDANKHEGKYWTYNSQRAFSELFPYWNRDKVKRILDKLVAHGLLDIGNFNKHKYDRTTWYSYTNKSSKLLNLNIVQNCTINCEKPHKELLKTAQPIPDDKTQIKNTDNLKEKNLIKKESEPTPIPTTPTPKQLTPVDYQTPFEQHLAEQEHGLLSETSQNPPNFPVVKSYYGGVLVDSLLSKNPYSMPEQLLNDFRVMREAQRKPITVTCWQQMLKQMQILADKGFDPIACFAHYVAAGWASFDHEYFLRNAKKKDELNFDSMDWGHNLGDLL